MERPRLNGCRVVRKPIIAAIPTIGRSPLLKPLVAALLEDGGVDEVLLICNEPEALLDIPGSPRIVRVNLQERSISKWWNWAIRYASVDGSLLALLNDDIAFTVPWAVSRAAGLFDDNHDIVVLGFNYGLPGSGIRYVEGSYRHYGVGGFAFMVDTQRCPLVDEQFQWWGTDDDLFMTVVQQGGKLALAMELTVEHVAETTAITEQWTYEARALDRERFVKKWGVGAAW